MEWIKLLIAALGGGALTSLFMLGVNKRKVNAEAQLFLAQSDELKTKAELLSRQMILEEITRAKAQIISNEKACDEEISRLKNHYESVLKKAREDFEKSLKEEREECRKKNQRTLNQLKELQEQMKKK